MVVMTIIVTLATIGMVQYRQSVQFAKESVLKDDLFKLRDAIDQYYADKNQYPPTLEDLVTAGYIRQSPDHLRKCQEKVANYIWRHVTASHPKKSLARAA